MAHAVEFRTFTPKNARQDLIKRLEEAPEEHAEALLATYELLQRLYDKGLIDVANGLLSASSTVVEKAVDVISSKPAVTATRAGLIGMNLLNNLDADRMHDLLTPSNRKPASVWSTIKQLFSGDTWRGMSVGIGLLNLFGSALRK
jgi:uncharacterized protein YjgD (DUF1641 family)